MTNESTERVDEVSSHYVPAKRADSIGGWLYWVCAPLSLLLLFQKSLPPFLVEVSQVGFIVLTVSLFFLFLASKLWLIPSAEKVRRKQLLTDAYGVLLTSEKTKNYYNNGFSPSHERLAANVMENSLFGRETSSAMLSKVRLKTFGYFIVWFAVLAVRRTPMETVLWISQLVFSVDVIAYWLSLEILRFRHADVFQRLYDFFPTINTIEDSRATAAILDSFASYESTKANAGVLLDSTVFFRENDRVSKEWERIKTDVGIPS